MYGFIESEFDPRDLEFTKEEDIRSLRELIIYGIKGMSAYMKHANALGYDSEDINAFMQETLAKTLDDSLSVDELIALTLETGKVGVDQLSGPVGIYSVVDSQAEQGFEAILYLVAYLSINVGIINLLPFPAFDGGHILFIIIEKIKGSPVNPKIENTIHNVGFILLMLLMVLITYNDIVKLF